MHFDVSGVDVHPLVPPLVAFVVSFVGVPAGVTGAFLLLPFQVSVLGFTGPSVSATNLVFNVVATPAAIARYQRDGRVDLRLTRIILAGTLPGVLLGAYLRVEHLPDPDTFRLLVGMLLLPLGLKLIFDVARGSGERELRERAATAPVFILSLLVGVGGGVYGIGGSAIIAPFLVGLLHLSTGRVVGATLIGTLITSVVGVATFYVLDVRPDWALGVLFGVGGLVGGYAGARFRNRIPETAVKALLGALATGLAVTYLLT